jgi:hypothetical protein
MLKLSGNPSFVSEASCRSRIQGISGLKDLERDFPLQSRVGGSVNDAHATRANFSAKCISRL